MNIRQKIENFFEFWSTTVVIYRWWVLLITLAISFAVIPQIRNGWVDVSIESFLPQHAPAMVDYNKFRREFGYAPGAMLVIETRDGAFTLENLEKIKNWEYPAFTLALAHFSKNHLVDQSWSMPLPAAFRGLKNI